MAIDSYAHTYTHTYIYIYSVFNFSILGMDTKTKDLFIAMDHNRLIVFKGNHRGNLYLEKCLKNVTTHSIKAFRVIFPVSVPSINGSTRSTSSFIMNLNRSSSFM